MKTERLSLAEKVPRARFRELGTKVLSVSKDEIEKREKEWRLRKKRRAKR